MALEFYAYPHLMGEEAVDYEIDNEEEDNEEDHVHGKMMNENGSRKKLA
jgi:hypothetical protein